MTPRAASQLGLGAAREGPEQGGPPAEDRTMESDVEGEVHFDVLGTPSAEERTATEDNLYAYAYAWRTVQPHGLHLA